MLFRCRTILQHKIMLWLETQGVAADDIAQVELTGPASVRVTNPAGQYMDLLCGADGTVAVDAEG